MVFEASNRAIDAKLDLRDELTVNSEKLALARIAGHTYIPFTFSFF